MAAALIPFAGLAVSRWRNGAGRKADIAAGPDWLVGFAWLDADAQFSDYAGHDRTIALIEGPGFTLDFGSSRPALVARRPYVPSTFDGGWVARCRVPDGLVVLEGSVSIDGQSAQARDAFRIEEAVTPSPTADARVALIRVDPARPG